jgi:hypothetical protein
VASDTNAITSAASDAPRTTRLSFFDGFDNAATTASAAVRFGPGGSSDGGSSEPAMNQTRRGTGTTIFDDERGIE